MLWNDGTAAAAVRSFQTGIFTSPYILEVYCYNPDKNEYIMEYMDYTLDEYVTAHNSKLTIIQRKGIAQQILCAFDYLGSLTVE